MNKVDILKAARAHVAKGWCKGGLEDAVGNVCLLGAINRAATGSARDMPILGVDDGYEDVRAHVPGLISPVDYNNAETTTEQDILDLIDKTLASLGGLA